MIDILVVDDSRLARKRTIELISKLDIEHNIIAEAQDGVQALEKFSELKPNLIITDIEMPNMDGIQLVKEIRKIDKKIDIIVISSIANEQIKQELKSEHSANFIKKPINDKTIKMLLIKLENELSLK